MLGVSRLCHHELLCLLMYGNPWRNDDLEESRKQRLQAVDTWRGRMWMKWGSYHGRYPLDIPRKVGWQSRISSLTIEFSKACAVVERLSLRLLRGGNWGILEKLGMGVNGCDVL